MHGLQAAILAERPSERVCRHGPFLKSVAVHHLSPDQTEWAVLWARCWGRIRTWGVPPRWTVSDWCDEARAQGALAAWVARREFDPGRYVPLDAFLYCRVVAGVRTRYRQEWTFGRRLRGGAAVPHRPVPESPGADPETLARLEVALRTLAEAGRALIQQLYWDGRSEDDLARERGTSRQAVNKRKQRILEELRRKLAGAGGRGWEKTRAGTDPEVADPVEPAFVLLEGRTGFADGPGNAVALAMSR